MSVNISEYELSVGSETTFATVGALSTALLANNTFLKEGDQLTFIHGVIGDVSVISIVLDSTSTQAISSFEGTDGNLNVTFPHSVSNNFVFAAGIVSREGESGQHLRSTTALTLSTTADASDYYKVAAKEAAIESYMAANGNTDWPQEQI